MQGKGRLINCGKQCNYCHLVDESYSKYGYPPWMKQRYRLGVNQLRIETRPHQLMEEDELQLNHIILNL